MSNNHLLHIFSQHVAFNYYINFKLALKIFKEGYRQGQIHNCSSFCLGHSLSLSPVYISLPSPPVGYKLCEEVPRIALDAV